MALSDELEKSRMLVRTTDAKVQDIQDQMTNLTGKKGKMQRQMLQDEIDGLLKDLHYCVAKKQIVDADASVKAAPKTLSQAIYVNDTPQDVVLPSRRKSIPRGSENVIQEDVTAFVERLEKAFAGNKEAIQSLGAAARSLETATLCHIAPQVKKGIIKATAASLDVIEALSFSVPLQHFCFPSLMLLFHDNKHGKRAADLATALVTEISSHGRATVCFLQPLLEAVAKPPGGKWKIKVGALDVLENLVLCLRETCPKQTASALPRIVPVLRDCLTDMRVEVKTKAKAILTTVGKWVTCPEVRSISDDLIACLVDSANMKAANEMLNRVANMTFLHYVDAASFALLFPLVSRAMKERAQDAQQKGMMIVGASALLIAEPTVILPPYLPVLIPLVKELLSEPQTTLQREAAKCMGTLCLALPHTRDHDLLPYMLQHLEQDKGSVELAENDRTGAALGLCEVIAQIPRFMNVILLTVGQRTVGKDAKTAEKKAGAYTMLEHLAKNDGIVGPLSNIWPWVLFGLRDDSPLVRSHAYLAAKSIVHEVGAPNVDVLLPPLIDAVLTFTEHDSRDLAMQLFSQMCDRLSESRKFGQDLLSMDCATLRSRVALVCLIQISRTDEDPAVRRHAGLLWKEGIQSGPKAKKEVMTPLMCTLKDMLKSPIAAKARAAQMCVTEMEAAGDIEAGQVQEQTCKGVFYTVDWNNLESSVEDVRRASHIAAGEDPTHAPEVDDTVGWDELEGLTRDALKGVRFPGWSEVEFLHALIVSTALESHNADEAVNACVEELADPKLREPLTQVYKKVYANYQPEGAGVVHDDHDLICKVDDLMLMYGGGHLLLKNTTLELRKGHRYGVVGRNGAGKTTLMNLIANGGVAKMPEHLRVVHVHHEQLLMVFDEKCVDFVGRDNKDCTRAQLEDALIAVQFPKHMWDNSVAELSGGWRMRLLLASAMIRGADVLLLDEPTNHLDVGAIAWLADYLNGLADAAIMVISHDPHFLDGACTDIIQYSQEKLVYHSGNFTEFKQRLGIEEDEAELLLQGNASDVVGGKTSKPTTPTSPDCEPDAIEEEDVKIDTADRKAKITFPVPGKVQGLTSASKPIMELRNVIFGYTVDKPPVLNDVSCKLTMNSRVAILGVNGAGKSTLLNLLCQEIHPAASALGEQGSVVRHRNCRLAYIAQQHAFFLADFLQCPPYVYIQKRFQYGWDEALQQRLMMPKNDEERELRKKLAKEHGKYGNEVDTLVGRQMRGNDLWYEIKWKNLDDAKQNTWENMQKLRDLGVESYALALDARMQAMAVQLDQRPLTSREIVKHLEQFGLTEEMTLNRQIGMFSAGQRSKLTLGASMWIKPHVIALDEPTNYIDMETLDSLAVALNRFKGAVVTISHSKDFITRVCNEQWLMEGGQLVVSKSIDAFEKMESTGV